MKMLRILFVMHTVALMAACSHSHHEVKNTPEGIKVGIGSEEIKSGDRVNVYLEKCKPATNRRAIGTETCSDKKLGEAIVLEVIDQKTAIVAPQDGLIMNETMTVEKQWRKK